MTQKNETPVLLLSLLATIFLIAGLIWWLGNRLNFGGVVESGNPTQPDGNVATPNRPRSLSDRFSAGERLLVTEGATAEKQAGVNALANGDYDQAVAELEQHFQERQNRNDPEALIYLNNARIGNQQSYTIAVSVPVENSQNAALEILRGAAHAQNEINEAGGINGVPLRVVIVSDDNDPEVVEEVANALVDDSSVLGVVGHFGSEASLAGAEIYEQGGLVMVSPTSTSVQLSSLGDYVFRTVPNDRFTASTLANYMVDDLQEQNAVVYYNSGSDYSTSLKNQFITALSTGGGQVVEEFDVSDASFDARSTLQQAEQRGAEVLVLATNTPTLDQALQVIRENRGDRPVLGGDSLFNIRVLEDGQRDAEGMVVAVPWVISSNSQSEFVADSRDLWGGDVNWRTAMSYDAIQVLIEGLSRDPSRQGIQQALSEPNFEVEGATGIIRFLSSGDRNQPMQLVVVEPGSRAGLDYDFVAVQ